MLVFNFLIVQHPHCVYNSTVSLKEVQHDVFGLDWDEMWPLTYVWREYCCVVPLTAMQLLAADVRVHYITARRDDAASLCLQPSWSMQRPATKTARRDIQISEYRVEIYQQIDSDRN